MPCQKYCTSQIWKPCARLLKYYAQGTAVFILTVKQWKNRKYDNKNLGQLQLSESDMILCISSGDKFYIEDTGACHSPLEKKKVGFFYFYILQIHAYLF